MNRVKGEMRAAISFLVALALLTSNPLAVLPAEPRAAGLTDPSAAAHVKFSNVGLAEAKWTHGFWADRLQTCRSNTLPVLGKIMQDADPNSPAPSQYLQNFRVAAGAAQGRHRGASFNDGDLYKWLEAVAAVYAVTKDAQLDQMMDEVVETIAKAQRSDGYLQTDVIIAQRSDDKS